MVVDVSGCDVVWVLPLVVRVDEAMSEVEVSAVLVVVACTVDVVVAWLLVCCAVDVEG